MTHIFVLLEFVNSTYYSAWIINDVGMHCNANVFYLFPFYIYTSVASNNLSGRNSSLDGIQKKLKDISLVERNARCQLKMYIRDCIDLITFSSIY